MHHLRLADDEPTDVSGAFMVAWRSTWNPSSGVRDSTSTQARPIAREAISYCSLPGVRSESKSQASPDASRLAQRETDNFHWKRHEDSEPLALRCGTVGLHYLRSMWLVYVTGLGLSASRISDQTPPKTAACVARIVERLYTSTGSNPMTAADASYVVFPLMIRTAVALVAILPSILFGQNPAPRFLYVYRDSLRSGVDSAYRAIENDGAQICADLRCPNPYIALESLRGIHEAWWINMFASATDTARVAKVYATDTALSRALGAVAKRKAALIGSPVQGFAVYRPDLSRGPVWSIAGVRFILVKVTRARRPTTGSVWVTPDSTRYILRAFRTRREAEAAARTDGGRVFAVRPNWSMPAGEWVQADREFWQTAPAQRSRP